MLSLILFRLTAIISFIHASLLIAADIPHIDLSLIPNIEEKLEILNTPEYADVLVNKVDNRPQKCPLRSEMRLSGIQQQLESIATALKYGECYDRNRELIDGFETLLSDDNQLFANLPWNEPNISPIEAGELENQALLRRQQVFTVLKTVSGDDACLYNVRKRGLLPVVADVVTNIGQVSALIPSMNGFYLSASAVSLGTALKIIVSIFGSKFDWKDINERRQFLQLNCNFFDLRRELESAEVVQIRDADIPAKIERSKIVRAALNAYLSELKSQRRSALDQVNQLKRDYLRAELPLQTLEISRAIEKFNTLIPNIDMTTPRKKIDTIQVYTSQLGHLLNLLEESTFDPPYKSFLLELLNNLSWEELPANIALETSLLEQNVLEPTRYYLNLYNVKMIEAIAQKEQEFLLHTPEGHHLSNGQIIEEIEDNYEQIFFEFLKTISFIDTRIEILYTKDSKLSLDAFDDGAHTIYDILENYHYIQSLLVGRLGYSYLDYFRQKMNQGLSRFKRSYQRFKRNYLGDHLEVDEFEDLWPCRDANNLRVLWEKVNSASEVANDFIQTNTGIFQSDVRRFDTFLSFIPVRSSREQAMLKYVRSAEYATAMINGEIPLDPQKLRRIEFFKEKNLGLLFLKRTEYESKRTDIENFWKARDCRLIL